MKDYTGLKKVILISIVVVAIGVSSIYGIIYYKKQEKESFEINESLNSTTIKKTTKKEKNQNSASNLVVDIKGEVKNPGIYKVDKNTRVIDVITMAGGLNEEADTSIINLSKKITDEMVIIVYSKQEVIDFVETRKKEETKLEICNDGEVVNGACIKQDMTSGENTMNGKININTARVEELQTLPGIGEAKAKNIINYREKNGNFTNIEGILEVEGIGNSIYDQIKNYITI